LKIIISILLFMVSGFATHTKFFLGFEYGIANSSYHAKVEGSNSDYVKDSSSERLRGFKMGLFVNSHERLYISYHYYRLKTELLNENESIYLFKHDYLFDLDYARIKPFLGFSIGKYTSTSVSYLAQLKNLYGINLGLAFHLQRFIDFNIGYRYLTDIEFNATSLGDTIEVNGIRYSRRFDAISHYYADLVVKF